MNLDKIIDAIKSIDLPTGSLSGGGIVLLLLALMFSKGVFKVAFVLLAIGLIAGAAWWHFQHQH